MRIRLRRARQERDSTPIPPNGRPDGHGLERTPLTRPWRWLARSRGVGLTVILTLLAGGLLAAQARRPTAEIATRVDTRAPAPGTTVRLVAHVRLPKEIHVQSNKPRDPDLIPTELTLTLPTGVTLVDVTYPAAEDLRLPGFPQPLAVYPNEFDIVVRVRLAANVGKGPVEVPAALRYQACNDSVCFPPSRAALSWSIALAQR